MGAGSTPGSDNAYASSVQSLVPVILLIPADFWSPAGFPSSSVADSRFLLIAPAAHSEGHWRDDGSLSEKAAEDHSCRVVAVLCSGDRVGPGLESADDNTAGETLNSPPGLRLIVLSSLFPSAETPNAGLFIRERMFRLAGQVPMTVVAPVAWSPMDWLIRRFRPGYRPQPVRHEVMDSIVVLRPRFLSVPGLMKRLDGLLMAWCCYSTVRRLRQSFAPTLIDGHFLYPDGFAAVWLGARLGIPVTVNIRGSKDQRLIGSSCESPMRWTLKRAAGILAVSDQLVRDVACPLGVLPGKVSVIGNGIDLDKFQPRDRLSARRRLQLAPDARVLIGVGNLIELKGFQRVIPLLPRLRERFPALQYLIVGSSAQQESLLPSLKRLAETHGVADVVRFCGPQPQTELAWFYSAADLFVLATAYEGWANVLLEALACGLPVVTTQVGGNPQVIASPEVGTLVDFWAPEAFSRAVAAALERDWDRQHLRDYAATHAWDRRMESLLKFLSDAAGRPDRLPAGDAHL